MIGNTLSHYKIIEKLGQGGMGEVYLAEDSRLDRKVALKILPPHLSDRAELRERFEREARAVSSLNHPHICTLYDIGEQDGIHYLVMEHLVGETLETRLAKGSLPLEQTLEYAIQIADALDKAHRQGVVHRDLKPGNIMLVKSGAKLLDFGLAKLQAADTPTNLSALPTEQANLTAEGTILGTLQHMAPEQLEGKEADSRTDIFAFGAVVYEMATGKKAFEGKSQASLIAAILKDDPAPMTECQPMTPSLLDQVVKKCLAKEPDERWQTASDLMTGLRWVTEVGTPVDSFPSATTPALWKQVVPWSVAAGLMGIFALWGLWPSSPSELPISRRLTITLPSPHIQSNFGPTMALSPDGQHFVYVSVNESNEHQFFRRSMDQFDHVLISGTQHTRNFFFSPNGKWVGFLSTVDGTLKKVSVMGGSPQPICEVSFAVRGASWGPDGNIIFGVGQGPDAGLYQVSASGGSPQRLTRPDSERDEVDHRWPYILPGGKAVLFTIRVSGSGDSDNRIAVLSLETGEWKTLIHGGDDPRYSPTGHLLFIRSENLMAAPFDLKTLEVTGESVPVINNVSVTSQGMANLTFSGDGTVIYLPAGQASSSRLVWVDRDGKTELVLERQGRFDEPRLSPDEQTISFTMRNELERHVWIYDLNRGTLNPLTFEGENARGLWTPDGDRIIFASNRTGPFNIYSIPAGGGEAELLVTREQNLVVTSVSQGGKFLFATGPILSDIWVSSLEGDRKPEPFLETRFHERNAVFSPDGNWVAFTSDRSRRDEIYIQPYSNDGKIEQISNTGGRQPMWSHDGKELFYRNGDAMMVVPIQMEPTFKAVTPQPLFRGTYTDAYFGSTSNYDVTDDGQRFVMVESSAQGITGTTLHVVLNWFEELKRLVPTDN